MRRLGGWKLDALGNVKEYLTVNEPGMGDVNLDGTIDFADLLLHAQNNGAGNGTWGQADVNGDGVVGFADLLLISQNFDLSGFGQAQYQARTHNYQNQITWMDLNDNDTIDGGESPVYDAEGNNTEDAQGQTLVYDAWNRMVAIKVGSTVKIAYEYDGLFRRIQETVGTTTHSQYYSASWQIIEERVDDEVRVQNVWSAVYIDAMVLRDRDSDANGTLEERVYPLFDANFNVSSIVDDEGAVLERYRYEPYGDRVVLNADFTPDTLAGSDLTTADDTEAGWNTSDVLFRHGHQGGAYDRVASEKMLFRFRTLDTQQMRWGQVDPLRYVDGMNAYQGYRGNPTNRLDASGLDADRVGSWRHSTFRVDVDLNDDGNVDGVLSVDFALGGTYGGGRTRTNPMTADGSAVAVVGGLAGGGLAGGIGGAVSGGASSGAVGGYIGLAFGAAGGALVAAVAMAVALEVLDETTDSSVGNANQPNSGGNPITGADSDLKITWGPGGSVNGTGKSSTPDADDHVLRFLFDLADGPYDGPRPRGPLLEGLTVNPGTSWSFTIKPPGDLFGEYSVCRTNCHYISSWLMNYHSRNGGGGTPNYGGPIALP